MVSRTVFGPVDQAPKIDPPPPTVAAKAKPLPPKPVEVPIGSWRIRFTGKIDAADLPVLLLERYMLSGGWTPIREGDRSTLNATIKNTVETEIKTRALVEGNPDLYFDPFGKEVPAP